MEALIPRVKEDRNSIIRKKIEHFNSSGRLYLHPDFPCYYTDGIQYVISLFKDGSLFLDIAMRAFALSREADFIVIRLCKGNKGNCWLEFCERSGKLLKQTRVSGDVPLEPGLSMYFYFIGRTLLLPNEF